MLSRRPSPAFIATLLTLALLLAWDMSGLDLALATPFGDTHGFFLRDSWLLSSFLHDDARRAAWLPSLWLVIGIWWPTGLQRRLDTAERVQWAAATLFALAAISLIKRFSLSSCPWDLAQFGGHVQWVSHWAWGVKDGGAGHCFPAGHASAGFAFLPGWFVLRKRMPRAAAVWLAGALLAGFVFGFAQQLRGAHFMSHTLWTAWLCWTIGWMADVLASRVRGRRSGRTATMPG